MNDVVRGEDGEEGGNGGKARHEKLCVVKVSCVMKRRASSVVVTSLGNRTTWRGFSTVLLGSRALISHSDSNSVFIRTSTYFSIRITRKASIS